MLETVEQGSRSAHVDSGLRVGPDLSHDVRHAQSAFVRLVRTLPVSRTPACTGGAR